MSAILNKAKKINDLPIDEFYVIYGDAGTGKTVLASTFPKSKEAPMLYLDFKEDGTGSISKKDSEFIDIIQINSYEELVLILEELKQGFAIDDNGNQVQLHYSTIVFDSATKLEYMMKQAILAKKQKQEMDLNTWGLIKQEHDDLWDTVRTILHKINTRIVVICHRKEVNDEENPGNNKIIPSLINSVSYALCANASFVWYTKIESVQELNTSTNEIVTTRNFVTVIDADQAYLTKTRKPKDMVIPNKIKNLTYPMFKSCCLDKIKGDKK